MAKVTFTRRDANTGARRVVNRTTAPMRAVLKQVVDADTNASDALQIEFPYGPLDVKYASIALRYQQIQRPGLQPLLVRSGPQLNVVTFTALIADKRSQGKDNVEGMLDTLKEMAAADVDCEFIYGLSALPYRVRITQMDINSRYRNFEGQLTQANVSVQLTESPDFDPLLGELSAVTPVGSLGTAPRADRVVADDEAPTPEDPTATAIDHQLVRQTDI